MTKGDDKKPDIRLSIRWIDKEHREVYRQAAEILRKRGTSASAFVRENVLELLRKVIAGKA